MATIVTAREFSRDVSAAMVAAADGPVLITDHGTPTHVLISYAEFQGWGARKRSLAAILRMDAEQDIDFDPGRVEMSPRPLDM